MGYSSQRTPFNLAEFLSQKATRQPNRKPVWRRKSAPVVSADENSEAEAAPEKRPSGEPRS